MFEDVLHAAMVAGAPFLSPQYGTSSYWSVDSKRSIVREIIMVLGLF